MIKKFLFCHLIICSLRLSVHLRLTDHSTVSMNKVWEVWGCFQVLCVWHWRLSDSPGARDLGPPCGHCWKIPEVSQGKNSDRSMQFQGSIRNAGSMSLQLLCNVGSRPCTRQCRIRIGFDSIWECKWVEALVLTCTYCELCSQLWGYMHNAFCLTVFCLSSAALLQAVIAGDLLKVSTEHWVSTFSWLSASLIYCKFYHTSAQNINRLL